MSHRIVLTTFGSLGDLHPYMAVGLALQARGHQVVIATHALYRDKIEAVGLCFHAIRPDLTDFGGVEEVVRQAMDLRHGSEYFVRQMVMPHLRASYEDLLAATEGADLLVTHAATYAGPLVAESRRIRWASSVLQPLVFVSATDPPVFAQAPALARLRWLGPAFHRAVYALLRRKVSSWAEPVRRLRMELKLPPSARDPLLEGQHAPDLVLAMFSRLLAAPQLDWPPQTVQTGFAFYDRQSSETGLSDDIERFLGEGPAPIVFTLGSTAVMDAGDFYRESAEAARRLGTRALLLIGPDPRNLSALPLPPGVMAAEYAPYSLLFPRASVIVHQGGVGTTGQALRAGRPSLIMPYSHDQPDNAARMARLGVARVISRVRYAAIPVAAELQALLNDAQCAGRAEEIGRAIRAENGIEAACDTLDAYLYRAE